MDHQTWPGNLINLYENILILLNLDNKVATGIQEKPVIVGVQ